MKKLLLSVFILSLLPITNSFGQCKTDLTVGQNLVINGDFSNNYQDWSFTPDSDGLLPEGEVGDGYKIFTGGYSVPGYIYVGTGADMYGFNNAFSNPFNGHTTGLANDKFLMVDGVCNTDITLWQQSNISVIPNTRYYFSVWINSLKANLNYPGKLNFVVNNDDNLTGGIIIAPNIGGGEPGGAWKKVEAYWDSGINPPATVNIRIDGNQTYGCSGNNGESDFAIDDISFIPGCGYSDNGPIVNLGPDQTLCGKGTITLNAGVPVTDSTLVTWSANTPGVNSGFGLTAPYSKIITVPGTYSVCVTAGNACTRSDIIVVTNTFVPNQTPDADLCGIPTAPLDAVFTGTGTTYQWKRNGIPLPAPSTSRTYGATTIGNYTVDVFTPGCGTVTSGITKITSAPTAAPAKSPNSDLCKNSFAPLDAVLTGVGIQYQWKRNGLNLPSPSNNKTYTALSPGSYTVDVTLPGCVTTTSATTLITSSASINAVDTFYCANLGAVPGFTLRATSTSNSANLTWYDNANNIINTGVTRPTATSINYAQPTIPMGTTGDLIYYIEDNNVNVGTVGPTAVIGDDLDFYPSNLEGNVGVYFNTKQNLKINSVQIPIYLKSNKGDMNISFDYTVYKVNATGGNITALNTPITGTTNVVTVPGTTSTYTFFTFNTAISISDAIALAEGPYFLLKITKRTSSYSDNDYRVAITKNVTSLPYASSLGANVASIIAGYSYGYATSTYGGLYNWSISSKTPCGRTRIRVINNCVTPVTWTSFNLVPQNNACKLVWNTANETNNAYFIVERSSDGIRFETISTITGAGNRDFASNYYYMDEMPLSGTSYYRISQVDYDGSSSSTSMKAYSSEGLIQITTYPNPFQNSTNLLVSGLNAETYTYSIYAISGQLVEQGTGTINQMQTIGETASKGMYMLTVITAGDIITNKIVKQ